jgi:DNA ligase (NAD+)
MHLPKINFHVPLANKIASGFMRYTTKQQQAFYEASKKYLSSADLHALTPQDVPILEDLARFHEYRYYVLDEPLLSDYEYDQLYKLLETLEKKYPEAASPNSPTKRVAGDLTEDFVSVKHLIPMLSLDNSYNADDLFKFDTQVKKLTELEDIIYTVEPKFDGGSIAIIYENNKLIRAATRGNGVEGEEITIQARTIKSLPLEADFLSKGIYRAEIRGEAVISKERFKAINKDRADDGLSLLANPRNSATGGLRTKDPTETARRQLDAFIFQLGFAEDENGNDVLPSIKSHHDAIDFLGSIGFKVSKGEKKLCYGIEEVIEQCNYWAAIRDDYPYEIDGMVIKVDSFDLQDMCGYTSHHPRWAIAFKFQAKQATTTLLDIEYQIGKVGSLTPVAKVAPVSVAGVTISSISLHNEDFIKSKDLRIGDQVLIERAGDVIPYIVKSLPELRTGNEKVVKYPTHCPSCNTPLVREEDEAAWRCTNMDCKAQILQRLVFHVSKDAMDIDGFGEKYIIRFYELGWIKTMADIYRLDYDKIAQLEGFGEKSAEKIKVSIEKAKSNPISRLLHSLSIHHLGQRASKLLAEKISHVLDLTTWGIEDYTAIKDIGPVVAENTIKWFSNEKNIEMLREMEAAGVNLHQTAFDKPKELISDGVFSGKTILFTGTLTQMGRKEAQQKAEDAGAKNISAVSKNLNILVVGESAGSKLDKARKIGTIQILTEAEFLDMLG